MKVLKNKVNKELTKDSTLHTIYQCTKGIRKFSREKRLELTLDGEFIAASNWVSPSTVIVFVHEDIKYYQAGVLGKITSTPI